MQSLFFVKLYYYQFLNPVG